MSQLFCFTYAGGTTSFYDNFEKYFDDNIKFEKLEYSGHGTRIKEPLYKSFDEASFDLYDIILKKYMGGTYALIGYSMGTLLAVHTLKYILDAKEIKSPTNIFLFAHSPKQYIDMNDFINVNTNIIDINNNRIVDNKDFDIDEYVKKRTLEFGAIPKSLLNNKTFWRTYTPIYKADYLMINNFNFDNFNFISDIPTSIFYGTDDLLSKDIKLWDKYFTNTKYYEFDGPHFFINNHIKEVANIMCNILC